MGIKEVIVKFKKRRFAVVPPEILLGMEGMAERNAERLAKIKEEMGTLYIMHPSHKKGRLDEPRPV